MEGAEDFLASRAGGERAVDDASFGFAFAALRFSTSSRIPGRLVGGEEQDGPVRVERILCAVAVVDIEINIITNGGGLADERRRTRG